jgi:hypothetical protein
MMDRPEYEDRLDCAALPARERLACAAMSLLIVWHTLAMGIAPAPESAITASARPLFDPYLTLFRLDNNWAFFAPGRALPGFEAYRSVVLRVPGLWWQVPFFYMPVFSRLFGNPIYNWIAANRSRL